MSLFFCLILFADSQDLVNEANKLFSSGDFQEAEKRCLEALVDSPESSRIEFNLGTIYIAQEDYAKAKLHLQKALQTRDPHLESKIKFNLGHTSFSEAQTGLKDLSDPEKVKQTIGRLQQSIRYWRDVLKLKKDDEDSKQNIVITTHILKDYLDRVKKHREEQQKKKDGEKGESLADILKELIEKQEKEEGRTQGIIKLIKERAVFQPYKEKLEGISKSLHKAMEKSASIRVDKTDNATDKMTIEMAEADKEIKNIRDEITKLLADPGFVEGASSAQLAENNLKQPDPDIAKGAETLNDSLKSIQKQITEKADKAKEEHKTEVKNQAEINGKTQGLVLGIEAKISGKNPTPPQGTPPQQNPQQQPPQQQAQPLSPEQKKVFEKVKAVVQEAVIHENEALSQLQKGSEVLVDNFNSVSLVQLKVIEKLKEALDLLPKKKQDQKQNQKQNQEQQKKDQQEKQKKEQKSVSRKQAENMLRKMKEKERQKKKEKQLLKAMGRGKVDKDW